MYNPAHMLRAISVAETNRCLTSPNPFVGAVLVKDGIVLSSGWTQNYGADHAEVQAIKKSTTDPSGADLYVTLEPCCHFGKTPPCTQAIIDAGIKNVYAGISDPNPKVNGKGFEILKNAGINVEYPYFKDEISRQLEFYLKWISTGLPFVITKSAVSLDGKISTENNSSKWISNKESRKRVHELRQQVDAVLTTINTVQKDDPMLNVRLENHLKNPIRIILDPRLQISINYQICQSANVIKTIIFYDKNFQDASLKLSEIEKFQIEAIPVSCQPDDEFHLNFQEILHIMGQQKICSILIEAGSNLNSFLVKNRYIDKVYYFISPKFLGGNKTVLHELGIEDITEQICLKGTKIEIIEEDVLVSGYLK